MNQLTISLFEMLKEQIGQKTQITQLSKITLVHISHTLEDMVIAHKLENALIFTGFQESSYWQQEASRYTTLAETAKNVYIFAGKALPEDVPINTVHVTLAPNDPLRQEWFLLICSDRFSALLCGQDTLAPATDEAHREFDTLISFDNHIIVQVIDYLEIVLQNYRPEKAERLRLASETIKQSKIDINLVSEFSMEMIRFQEKLNKQLRTTNRFLKEQKRLNDLLVELSPAFIAALDESGQIIGVNRLLMNHLRHKQTVDEHSIGLIPFVGDPIELLNIQPGSNEDDSWETTFTNQYGEKIIVDWRTRKIELEGEIIWLAVGFDITEQRFIHETLLRSEAQFREVVTSIPEYIYVLERFPDGHAIQTYASPQVEKITGYTDRDVMQAFDFWTRCIIHPDDLATAKAQFHRLEIGENSTTEYRIVRADNEIRWVRDSAHSIYNPKSDGYSIYGVVDDITERKNADRLKLLQQTLELELEQEREYNLLQNKLMTTISHQFRTPLTAILSSIEIMNRYSDHLTEEDRRVRRDMIQEQVLHMRNMLDDINDILRVQRDEIKFEPRNIDLRNLITTTIDEVRQTTDTKQDIMAYYTNILAELKIDPRILKQIIRNLLNNAITYSPPDSNVTIHAVGHNREVSITVSNQGHIREDDIDYIFDAFYRGKNTEHTTGTGLGLKLVKDYVTLHHGTVSCANTDNHTVTFTVTLPYSC